MNAPVLLSAPALDAAERCARLFRYLYLDRLGGSGEGFEASEQQGQAHRRFCRLVELAAQNRRIEPLLAAAGAQVQIWWERFTESPHSHPQGQPFFEYPLWVRLGSWRISTHLNRLSLHEKQLTAFIWNTDLERPEDGDLLEDWQLRLARTILCLAGERLVGGRPMDPADLRLVVWFANAPARPYTLNYSPPAFEADRRVLTLALQRLERFAATGYPMSADLQVCSGCLFRTRCYGLRPEGPMPFRSWEPQDFAPLEPQIDGPA
ncbi:PD-(D/E)XK nuclease family protein [Gloeobacter violaceus]|nr:PD-(D/E)XK nuclease family protein [Gloeobacter violaceus]